MNGKDILNIAKNYIGSPYKLGTFVPKDQKDYKGPFDCAEFVAYCIFQTFDILYGCDQHDINHAHTADAYTGYFDVDAHKYGRIISVDEATRIPGAIVLRIPKGTAIGHVVISQGNGKTYEANSTKYGTGEFSFTGRRFDLGILLPYIDYDQPNPSPVSKPPAVVYRLKTPYMKGDFVSHIQQALGLRTDGIYGVNTEMAVVNFQKKMGLVVDGEVMPGGQTANALNIHI